MSKPKKIKPEGADGHRARMFAKFLNTPAPDANLRDVLEMLLYYPIKVRDTRDSAVELMKRYDSDLQELLCAPTEDLCETDGIGPRCALFLNVVGEIVNRLNSGQDSDYDPEYTEEDILYEFMERCAEIDDEKIAAVFYDSSKRFIGMHIFDASPRSFDQNDMYRLMSLASGYHAAAVSMAHLVCGTSAFPDMADTRFRRYISDALYTTGLVLTEYYFINRDEAIVLN